MARFVLKELCRYELGTYAEVVLRNALFYPDRETFIFGDKRVTFSAFNAGVNRLVRGLNGLGLRRGDGIGVLAWNCLEYAYVYGAAMKGGFIISPFNQRLKPRELEAVIDYSRVKALFVGDEFLDALEEIGRSGHVRHVISLGGEAPGISSLSAIQEAYPDSEPDVKIGPDDPLFIFYTSGTTGRPRGALYTHARAIEDTKTFVMMTGIKPSDRFVLVMPFFHIGGAKVCWSYFYVGASHVILKGFDPRKTLLAIEKERATDIHLVPTQLVAIFSVKDFDRYDLSSLKRIWYAASPMPTELLKKGLDMLGPVFMQAYGATETGPNVCCLRAEEHTADPGRLLSCGRPDLGVHARVVDDNDQDLGPGEIGEIIVRGNTMIGYWRQPQKTAEVMRDGWFYTGDMGYYDELGYIYIVDRRNDMIISGGENIYPREVEEVLYRHPSVKEAAVIGVPDEYWVERVHAVVVLHEGRSLGAEELIRFCKERIAGYKAPKSVEFVDSLPKTASGKILKRELVECYRHGAGGG